MFGVRGYLCAVLGCPVSAVRCPPRALSERYGRTARRPEVCTPPLSTTCSAVAVLIDQVDLPVRLLDPDVQVTDLPGDVVGLVAKLGDWEGGEHLQF